MEIQAAIAALEALTRPCRATIHSDSQYLVKILAERTGRKSMYDHTAVKALEEVRRVVDQLGPAILFRKLYGVLNAVEIQIEDGNYRSEAIRCLGEALREVAVFYELHPAVQNRIAQEYETFMTKLQKP
jgi:hypothetical protein